MPTYSDPTVVELSASPKLKPGTIIALVAGVIALLGAGFIYFQETSVRRQIEDVESDNTTTLAQRDAIANSAGKELSEASQLAVDLHLLFDNQTDWTKTLNRIQGRLYTKMAVTALDVDEKGVIALSGLTYSYEDYAKIFRSLTDVEGQKVFSSAKPLSMSRSTQESEQGKPQPIQFSFALTLASAETPVVATTPVPAQ